MIESWKVDSNKLMKKMNVTEKGLSDEQVLQIREKVGENLLEEAKKKSVLQVFLSQFCDLLVIILIIAAVISAFSENPESTIVIIAVLIMNSILGTVQHIKAEKSLESLKQLSSPSAKIMRNGIKIQIPSKEVVPGDILVLEAGDLIVADGRIINNYSLQVNESSLTGESTNVEKTDKALEGDIPLADRINMVYSGSLVVYGRAEVLVTETGMNTEIGKIAGLMNKAKERKTPLQKSLDQFSGRLAIGIMIISAVVFVLCLIRNVSLIDSLMFAVALAVAAIPEALGSIVTIVQAIGTGRMASENAIIKDLKAVESLGCVSVICSDKTGTLTQNKMTVEKVYVDGDIISPNQLDLKNQLHRDLVYNAILSNDSSIVDGKGIGDPTEYALLEMFRNIKVENFRIENGGCKKFEDSTVENNDFNEKMLNEEDVRRAIPRLQEIPFDSDRKLMSVKCKLHDKETVLTKGALDVLLNRCIKIRKNNQVREISQSDIEEILKVNEKFSNQGLRVLSFAYKEADEDLTIENEKDFIFLGLIAMIDPPREESVEAVQKAKEAGIKTVMITGDHKITATAIAKKLGILEDEDEALTGLELEKMSDEDLQKNVRHYSVYARVSPEHKVRIVKAWQKNGEIVAMTGDGVNDSPALKTADIGCAMGVVGTDVAKEAAEVILTDDNFATIVSAVEEGRRIYDNILKVIQFLLSSNVGEIIVLLLATLCTPLFAKWFGITDISNLEILLPIHILWINLVTDSLPALALAFDPANSDIMKRKPAKPNQGVFTKGMTWRVIYQGAMIGILTLVAFMVGLSTTTPIEGLSLDETKIEVGQTMAFVTLAMSELVHVFNIRDNKKSIFKTKVFNNSKLIWAIIASAVLMLVILAIPVLREIFSIPVLPTQNIVELILLILAPLAIVEIFKLLKINTIKDE